MTHDSLTPASQPPVLVAGFLLDVPLDDERGWRAAQIRRQKVLWRLVVRTGAEVKVVGIQDAPE